jgi:rubrerythrin
MNTCDLLENCIRIERTLAEIYETFMKQQASQPVYALLWEKTAQEEHNHEQQFILAKRLACSTRTDPTNVPHPSDDLVRKLQAFRLHIAEEPLSPGESIRLAIELEEKLSAFHMNQMHIFSDESTNRLFNSMMNYDNQHVEALKSAFANLP